MSNSEKSSTSEQRVANRRLGLILGTIVLAFLLGMIFKRVVFGSQPDKRRVGR